KTIRIRGLVVGQDGEQRSIRFIVGIPSDTDDHVVATPFVTTNSLVTIQKAFITTSLALNGVTTDDVVARTGATIRVDLSWQNNLSTPVSDMEIQVALSGTALNRNSVTVPNGFYRSSDNTVIFNKRNILGLDTIASGNGGKASFSLTVLPPSAFPSTSLSNAGISFLVTTNAKSSDTETARDLSSVLSRHVKITTDFHLTSRGLYFSGPFTNTGPIPPKVDQDTTYTIVWSVDNNLNLVRRGQVTATIPSYVTWMNIVTPSDQERVSYNPDTGKITWDLGDVRSGTGSASPRREVSFRVSLRPSLSQLGSSPVLVSGIQLTGVDSFTGTSVGEQANAISTRLLADPLFDSSKDDKVIN
ncbi:MAG: hypothetical protein WCW14_03570, partial [Candidatus Paceibacterota bacterium]